MSIWSFNVDGSLHISCTRGNDSRQGTHGFINFTMRPPFAEQKVLEPFDCNSTYHFYGGNLSELKSDFMVERSVHPSERLGCNLISAISVLSIIYCLFYIYGYAYLRSSVDLFSQNEVMSEVLTSLLLTCCWLVCTISWTASVASLKHFAIFFLPYTSICQDSQASCSLSGSITKPGALVKLYTSIFFGYLSVLLWFACCIWRIYCNSRQVVFPSSNSLASHSQSPASMSVLSPSALINRTIFAFTASDEANETSAKFTRMTDSSSSPCRTYQVTLSSAQGQNDTETNLGRGEKYVKFCE